MTWAAIFAILIKIFGPFLFDLMLKLFEKWFKKSEKNLVNLDPGSFPPHVAVAKLFDEMETVLPRIAPARKLLLRTMKRIAVSRAKEIMSGDINAIPALNSNELDDLKLSVLVANKEK